MLKDYAEILTIKKLQRIIRDHGRYVIWLDKHGPDGEDEYWKKAYEDIENIGNITLSKYPKSEHYGDDWNDSPAESNAGAPYDDNHKDDNFETLYINSDTKLYTEQDVKNIIWEIFENES